MTAQELKDIVALTIRQNGNQEITGYILQQELFRIIDESYNVSEETIETSFGNYPNEITVLGTQNPPGAEVLGNRYLIGPSPTGVWAGHKNEIAEWDGTNWLFTAPILNGVCYVAGILASYRYDGTNWILFPGVAIRQHGQSVSTGGLVLGTTNAREVRTIVNNIERTTLDTNGVLNYTSDVSPDFTSLALVHKQWVEDYVASNGGLGAGQGLTANAGNIDLGGVITQLGTEILLDSALGAEYLYINDPSGNGCWVYLDTFADGTGSFGAGTVNSNNSASSYMLVTESSVYSNTKTFTRDAVIDMRTDSEIGGHWIALTVSEAAGDASAIQIEPDGIFLGFGSGSMQYNADYSANFVDRSLVDKAYVDAAIAAAIAAIP